MKQKYNQVPTLLMTLLSTIKHPTCLYFHLGWMFLKDRKIAIYCFLTYGLAITIFEIVRERGVSRLLYNLFTTRFQWAFIIGFFKKLTYTILISSIILSLFVYLEHLYFTFIPSQAHQSG